MVFVFPGQGSQHSGMGKWLVDHFSEAKQVFEEASDSISLDLQKLCFTGSDTELALTENTQPAIVTVACATEKVIRKNLGLQPRFVAGHSVGEYAALVSAGVMTLSQSVRAVRLRGKVMQQAVPAGTGGMAAVMGLNLEQIQRLCAEVQTPTEKLEPANDNSPGQIVVSGSMGAIQRLREMDLKALFPEVRVKVIPLQVSAPFHCSLMAPAEKAMSQLLKDYELKDAQFPIVQNVLAKPETLADKIRENLVRQICAPVLWTQTMEFFKQNNESQWVECGAGKVLAGLAKKTDGEFFRVSNLNSLDDFKTLEVSAAH